MSPTADDLRALLIERADDPAAAAGVRLVGVRRRIHRRRRMRTAAAALSVAVLAGSAGVVGLQLRPHRSASAPAVRPSDPSPRPSPSSQAPLPDPSPTYRSPDSHSRDLAATLVAQPGRPAAATVRLRSGEVWLLPRCTPHMRYAVEGQFPRQACNSDPGVTDSGSPPLTPGQTIRVPLTAWGGGVGSAARVAIYGDVDVLSVVQPVVEPMRDGTLAAVPQLPGPTPPEPAGSPVPRPHTADVAVAAGQTVVLNLRTALVWGFQQACSSDSLRGTITYGASTEPLAGTGGRDPNVDENCVGGGAVVNEDHVRTYRMTISVRPGHGTLRLALYGATVISS